MSDKQPQPQPQAGDIAFYSGADWTSHIIERGTLGPFSHAAIVVSSDAVIEAQGRAGIVRSPLRPPAALARTSALLSAEGLACGIAWAERQLRDPYSWWDIAGDALGLFLPSRTPFLVAPSSYCCSDLASRFLAHAGLLTLPDDVFDQPSRVSPNRLARALGVPMPGDPPQLVELSPWARDFIRRMDANPHAQAMLKRLADK